MATRRESPGGFKPRVAKDASWGNKSIQRIAARHYVRPNQASQRKRNASEGLVEMFEWGLRVSSSTHSPATVYAICPVASRLQLRHPIALFCRT